MVKRFPISFHDAYSHIVPLSVLRGWQCHISESSYQPHWTITPTSTTWQRRLLCLLSTTTAQESTEQHSIHHSPIQQSFKYTISFNNHSSKYLHMNSITLSFTNHSNMMISYYYQCWNQLSCLIFMWKMWHFFHNSLMNRKLGTNSHSKLTMVLPQTPNLVM